MRLHVLAGRYDLLFPAVLEAEEAASVVADNVRIARAHWLSADAGDRYHDFLQEEPDDRRVAVMADALKDGFGARHEPLLVLARLLEEVGTDGEPGESEAPEDRRTQLAVIEEILGSNHFDELRLYGLAVPSKADPDSVWAVPAGLVPGSVRERIEALRDAVAGHIGADAVETRVIEATPDFPVFNTLYNNAFGNHLVRRLGPRMQESGWHVDPEVLAGAVSNILEKLNRRGVYAGLPLGEEKVTAMADLVHDRLLKA